MNLMAVIASVFLAVVIFSGCIEQKETSEENFTFPEERADAVTKVYLTLNNYPELFATDVMIVIGENASQMDYEGAEAIAEQLKKLIGNEPLVKSDRELTEIDKSMFNLIIVGSPKNNRLLGEIYKITDALKVTEEYPGEHMGILEILRNPWNDDKALLLIEGTDEIGVQAGAKAIIGMDKRIQNKLLIVGESLEVIVEVPHSIKLRALEAYNLSDGKISIPIDLYIDSYPSGIRGYYIVQFKGQIYEEYKTLIIDLGGEFFNYIPDNAFIVKMNLSTRDKIQKIDVINWIGIYQPAYKVSSNLINKTGNITLTVGVFCGENITNISREIESIGGIASLSSENIIRVLINASMVPCIANIWGVEYVEEYVMPEISKDLNRNEFVKG
jgi:hypothetical protein